MAAAHQIGVNHEDGMNIGASATSKLGFFGTAPVVQQTNVADATNTTTTTSTTTALTTDLDSVRTKLNAVIARLENLGLLASS